MSVDSEMAKVVASLDRNAQDISHEPELGALAELLRTRYGDGVLRWMLGAVNDSMASLGNRVHDALAPRPKLRVLGQHMLINILLDLTGEGTFPEERRRIDPELAADLVARDVGLTIVVGALRHMQREWLVGLIDATEAVGANGHRLMPDLAGSVTMTMDAWVGTMIEAMVQERRRVEQTEQRRTRDAIESLISGGPIDVVATSAALRRPLGGWHTCCVLGAQTGDVVERQQLDAAVRALERLAGGSPLLRYETAGGNTYLWTTTENTVKALSVEKLGISPPIRAGIGEPRRGADGFRRSFIEANDALRLAIRSCADRALHYRDVTLAVTLVQDDERASWFVEHELGDLAGDSADLAELRESLRVFFATRMRVAPAADRLFVHRNTLIQRIERIETIIGHPLSERTAEVQAALAIAELYLSGSSERSA